MTNFRKKLLYMAAGAVLALSSATVRADGPTSGVGGDGFTRFMWKGTGGQIRLEKCDANLGGCTMIDYGPVPTWHAVAYCVTNSNDSYVLWRDTQGDASVWRLGANQDFISSKSYGPVSGWEVVELSCDTLAASTLRLLWKNSSGALAIWVIARDLTPGLMVSFTQPFGWYPDGPESATAAASNAKATEAMARATAALDGAQR